jgi:hypothetical protein
VAEDALERPMTLIGDSSTEECGGLSSIIFHNMQNFYFLGENGEN